MLSEQYRSATPATVLLGSIICFSDLVGDVFSPTVKLQAKPGRSRGGFGIRSLVRHANAALVPSFCHALPDSGDNASLRLAAEELRREPVSVFAPLVRAAAAAAAAVLGSEPLFSMGSEGAEVVVCASGTS